MTGADKVVCQAATLLLLFTLTTMPAKAQSGGFGGGGFGGAGGGNIMGMLGGAGGGEMMSMIPQLMRMTKGGGHRRHRRR